jgi:hypothetical protein
MHGLRLLFLQLRQERLTSGLLSSVQGSAGSGRLSGTIGGERGARPGAPESREGAAGRRPAMAGTSRMTRHDCL